MIVYTETSRYDIDPLNLTATRTKGDGRGGFPGREDLVQVADLGGYDGATLELREFRQPIVGECMFLPLANGDIIRTTKVREIVP